MEKKEVRIVSKNKAEEADYSFWKSKSPEERLDAVQYLREQWVEKFHNQQLYNESRKGLRRFYKVTKRK